ncbi:uncharacterized protein PRCAT00005390001 [Priceomyces carsonii]|uniref:uncharacterized protein n=1 Tax=Priceomyces carsonii TaxID=28549 RepID=UPI002ED9289B|nr:unnamed protein product [Priceomyces carsonii]
MSSLDLGFIQVNQLCYRFITLSQSSLDDNDERYLINLATECLDLMDHYNALHPSYKVLVTFLESKSIKKYNSEWIKKVQEVSDDIFLKGKQCLVDLESSIDLSNITTLEVLQKVKSTLISLIIQTQYQDALQILSDISSLLQFTSQPSDYQAVQNNAFIEYYFYQYITKLFSSAWSPDEQDKLENFQRPGSAYFEFGNTRSQASSFKMLRDIVNRVSFYYNKNEFFLTSEGSSAPTTELKYYWIISWFHSTIAFKGGKFVDYVNDIDTILATPSINGLTPLTVLSELPVLKSNILVLLEISMICTRPFKALSLAEEKYDNVLGLLESTEGSLENQIYLDILLPLAETKYKNAKILFSDEMFIKMFEGSIGYIVPLSVFKGSGSFLDYIRSIIDFKSFLVIISVSKRIQRTKLLKILGYENDDNNSQTFQKLLILIAALNLGELGIGFDYQGDYFYNYESNLTEKALFEKLHNLSNNLEAESIANIMKGVLLEKFFS